MSKSLTLFIIDDKGTRVSRTNINKAALISSCFLFITALVFLAFFIHNYNVLNKRLVSAESLLGNLDEQKKTISEQKLQIESFAYKINSLQSEVISLNKFEKKIRIIANLDHDEQMDGLFGMGGSSPDDLNPDMIVKEDHKKLVRKMHNKVVKIADATKVQAISFDALVHLLKGKKSLLAATPSIRPLKGWISSGFGYRTSPFTERREFHRGLDIAAHSGTPIIAPANGTVTYSGRKGLMGNMITIDHGFGIITRYGHISTLLKKRGKTVKRGETIALVGNTGRSTGPHLHYEVRLNGVPINPKKYFMD